MLSRPLYFLLSSTLVFASALSCQTSVTQKPVSEALKSERHIKIANQFAKEGLLREAIGAFKKALRKEPDNSMAHRNLGMTYVKIGDYKRASKHLEKAIAKFDDNFEANYYLAEAYRALAAYGKAIYRYQRALEISPNNPKALKSLAWSFHLIRFYSEALRVSRQLEQLLPADPQGAIIAARTYLKIGNLRRALTKIRRAQALSHKSNLAYLRSVEGDIYLRMEQTAKAEEIYRSALKDQPLLAGALLGLGKCLLKTGNQTDLAIEYMERAIRIKPRLKEGLYLLGKIYETKDPAKSQKYYSNFRKYASTDPEYLDKLYEINSKGKKNSPQDARKPLNNSRGSETLEEHL